MKMPKKVTTDDLARMMTKGFENMVTKDDLANELSGIKQDIEEIKLKFDNVAFKFEVKELERRVTNLEREIRRK